MTRPYSATRHSVSMLGTLLGNTIREALGDETLNKIETIRRLSKSSRSGNDDDRQSLTLALKQLSNQEILPVAKAFNQFLNLVNTAEQYQEAASYHGEQVTFSALFEKLKKQSISDVAIKHAVESLSIELVLTAHPTEINRRSFITQQVEINNCLAELDHSDLSHYDQHKIMRRLRQLVSQSWYTNEIRESRPTPIDEAKWGFSVIESSLWQAVPAFLRELNEQLESAVGSMSDIHFVPVKFTSWMGGDRDGNPNVTAEVTKQVMLIGRLKAATLFLQDIQTLVTELSITPANEEVQTLAGGPDVKEPYRAIMKQLRSQLISTINYLNLRIEGHQVLPPQDLLMDNEQLWQPLYACYRSLQACGMNIVANGLLLDILRRIRCFGLTLVRLDIRQDSSYHQDVFSELTQYLELGDYAQWSEEKKQTFLLHELNSKRPLFPQHWPASKQTQEVLNTFTTIAQSPKESIAAYVISMAKTPSDILAVELLLREAQCPHDIPVVPLFETLDDLNHAEGVMKHLFSLPWYRDKIQGKQMVMIGYSDSAKDAGVFAASWAQYQAQEALLALCEKESIALTLFHGRGGSNGRGGVPAHAALLSQPPGSLRGGLRVTEQGEMIRFKLGLPQLAINSLTLYASAILEANLLLPPKPQPHWRTIMETLASVSCQEYRSVVRDNPDFVRYFRQATPEQELGRLPLGSRPAKRKSDGGIESLRAIPWIFAWTQNRLMLPSWLGAGTAIAEVIAQGKAATILEMCQQWPFFLTRMEMLEMVFAKTDLWLAEHYDKHLVEPELQVLGEQLRTQLQEDIQTVLNATHDKTLMQSLPWGAESIALRNIYTDPLNLLQVELLERSRDNPTDIEVEQALMVTISGIAAGMRNTG